MSAIETNGDTDRSVDAALIEQLEERFSPRGIRRRRLRRYQSVLWLVWVNALDGIKRLFDFVVSSALLLVLAPLLLLLYGLNRLRGGDIERSSRLGRWGCIFEQYSFSSGVARGLPALVNVWLGDMSLIGPRPIGPGEVSPAER